MKTAIYARISHADEGDTLGVERQIADCQLEAERRGWEIVATYIDNNVSASRSKVRPEFQRMVKAIEAGMIEAVTVWDVDRLTRSPRELEDIIDLADRKGLSLASVGGEIDLGTPQGRMTARIKGTVARHEVEQSGRRVRRKLEELALAGKPVGKVAFGFKRVQDVDERGRRIGVRDEIDEAKAVIVREMAQRVLAGESITSIARDLNSRNVSTAEPGTWHTSSISRLLVRPSLAGLRSHNGVIVSENPELAIISKETHERLVALISDPSRRSNKGGPRFRYLLSGIAECGKCGGKVRRANRTYGTAQKRPSAYICGTCHGVARNQKLVDELVESVIVEFLSKPEAKTLLNTGSPAVVSDSRRQVEEIKAKLAIAADQFADDILTADQLRRVTEKLRPELEKHEAMIQANLPGVDLHDVAGIDAGDRWQKLPLDVRRQVVEKLVTVTILPTPSGEKGSQGFNPEFVRITWNW